MGQNCQLPVYCSGCSTGVEPLLLVSFHIETCEGVEWLNAEKWYQVLPKLPPFGADVLSALFNLTFDVALCRLRKRERRFPGFWKIKATVACVGSRLLDKRFSLCASYPFGFAADDAMNTAP